MSEKRTLSQWLRRQEIYQDGPPKPVGSRWQDALLADFEHGPALSSPIVETPTKAP